MEGAACGRLATSKPINYYEPSSSYKLWAHEKISSSVTTGKIP